MPDRAATAGSAGAGGATPIRRRQADRRAESDRRMMRAAISLIAANGSKGVSMAQIGMAAGFSRGLPAERFGTKLALLEAVVDVIEAWFTRRVPGILAGRTGLAALEARILGHMESVRDSSEAAIALYHLMVEAMATEPELQARITRLNAGYRAGMLLHLQEARAAGELRPGVDMEAHAMAIVSGMHGTAIQAVIDGETAALGPRARYLAEVLITAIRAEDGTR
ncbi:TetR/AcrR family transcriptional regulator [Marinibaculum pumilum]|uniref:TetR/AcrR family transcriptional regulator n=1 Tax=Marinibaculum pumilum TaxID=1766165 RepID=A0ABV7KV79_9PROT